MACFDRTRMATLTKNPDGSDSAKPLGVPGENAPSGDSGASVPARSGKNPPKYPQAPRRPPNMPPSGGAPPGPRGPMAVASGEGGFFSIRKKGQGYWTRMGTVGGAVLIGALSVQFLYSERETINIQSDSVAIGLCTAFAIGYGLLMFYLMNKPTHVDFLIATDSEMKKVNWTSREELIGSTKVVILFMFIIAIFLFVADLFFGYFFYWIGVLKEKPF
jgi:preprotein translocase subunit SecE